MFFSFSFLFSLHILSKFFFFAIIWTDYSCRYTLAFVIIVNSLHLSSLFWHWTYGFFKKLFVFIHLFLKMLVSTWSVLWWRCWFDESECPATKLNGCWSIFGQTTPFVWVPWWWTSNLPSTIALSTSISGRVSIKWHYSICLLSHCSLLRFLLLVFHFFFVFLFPFSSRRCISCHWD